MARRVGSARKAGGTAMALALAGLCLGCPRPDRLDQVIDPYLVASFTQSATLVILTYRSADMGACATLTAVRATLDGAAMNVSQGGDAALGCEFPRFDGPAPADPSQTSITIEDPTTTLQLEVRHADSDEVAIARCRGVTGCQVTSATGQVVRSPGPL